MRVAGADCRIRPPLPLLPPLLRLPLPLVNRLRSLRSIPRFFVASKIPTMTRLITLALMMDSGLTFSVFRLGRFTCIRCVSRFFVFIFADLAAPWNFSPTEIPDFILNFIIAFLTIKNYYVFLNFRYSFRIVLIGDGYIIWRYIRGFIAIALVFTPDRSS